MQSCFASEFKREGLAIEKALYYVYDLYSHLSFSNSFKML